MTERWTDERLDRFANKVDDIANQVQATNTSTLS